MNANRLIPALALAMIMSAPAQADDRDPLAGIEPLLDPQVLLGGIVSEDDVGLLFAHLRACMLAAGEGREPPPLPEALGRRLDTAAADLRVRGTLLGLVLSQTLEHALRDALRRPGSPAANPMDGSVLQ
jgi:hypothetical protein